MQSLGGGGSVVGWTKKAKKAKKVKKSSNQRKLFWITLYAFYVVFILLSLSAYYAEYTLNTRATGKHSYILSFDYDGEDYIEKEHYKVKLVNNEIRGIIWVTYDVEKHDLDVASQNILELEIDCRSIAEEKSKELIPTNYRDYKDYFIKRNLFTVEVNSDHIIDLTLKDIPYPYKVTLNGEDVDFTYSKGKITTMVPEGKSNVDISFQPKVSSLVADFTTNNKLLYHLPKTAINFDASKSSPSEDIEDYIWDFGDGSYGTEVKIQHTYPIDGNYDVTLVVRDKNNNIARVNKTIYAQDKDSDNLPDKWERYYFMDLSKNRYDDVDSDGLNNEQEYLYNTDPTDKDTDGDGFDDGYEKEKGTDPLDPTDKPSEKKAEEGEGINPTFLMIGAVIIIIIILLVVLILSRRSKQVEEGAQIQEEIGEGEIEEQALEGEEEEIYTCPECGTVIEEDQQECFDCGAVLEWEEEEIEEVEGEDIEGGISEEPKKDEDLIKDIEMEGEGEYEEGGEEEPEEEEDLDDIEIEEEEYECPTCGSSVGTDDIRCPQCGEEFE